MDRKIENDVTLRIENVTKSFGGFVAVNTLSLDIAEGEFLTLLGPSGCGKTTTLNLVAGFLTPTSGSIFLQGRAIEDLPPYKRNTGMVFQDYALFPHLTVEQNIGFGLEMRKVPKEEIHRRVGRGLELVRLAGLGGRKPSELSGGQRQRVALARALVIEPAVLLFDEPLSNLDLKLREAMRSEITSIQRELGITAIYVTHDQHEALTMSDRIAVMNEGHIEQLGTAAEIYEKPQTKFVAEFIGNMNLLAANYADGTARTAGGLSLPVPDAARNANAPVFVTMRPERCRISADAETGPGVVSLGGTVQKKTYYGSLVEYEVRVAAGEVIKAELHNNGSDRLRHFDVGESVFVTINHSDIRLYDKQ